MRDDPRRKATASNLFLERHSTGAEETNRILVRRSRSRQVERACAYVRTVLEVQVLEISPLGPHHRSAAMRSARRRSSPLLQGHGSRADVARTSSLCLIERPEMAGLGPQVTIPRQSRGLYDVSRSKRLGGVANAAPTWLAT